MSEAKRVLLIMKKGNDVKEIDVKSLPGDVVKSLEEAYDRTKVVGISRETYAEMVEVMALMLSEYSDELATTTDAGMYSRAVAFANGCGIDSTDSRLLFDILCWVDRNVREHGNTFTSRDVNIREIRAYLKTIYGKCSYYEMSTDFGRWARKLFSTHGLKVGFVKFAKFYLSLVNCGTVASS